MGNEKSVSVWISEEVGCLCGCKNGVNENEVILLWSIFFLYFIKVRRVFCLFNRWMI